MLVRIRVNGYITLDVPPNATSADEDIKQEWLNRFSLWVQNTQEEWQVPEFDDVEAFVEDIDFLVVD